MKQRVLATATVNIASQAAALQLVHSFTNSDKYSENELLFGVLL